MFVVILFLIGFAVTAIGLLVGTGLASRVDAHTA
jgi:hypothetical protein